MFVTGSLLLSQTHNLGGGGGGGGGGGETFVHAPSKITFPNLLLGNFPKMVPLCFLLSTDHSLLW